MRPFQVLTSHREGTRRSPLLGSAYRGLGEEYLRSLRASMPFDIGLLFLEDVKQGAFHLISCLSQAGLSPAVERAIAHWSIKRESVFQFADQGLQNVPETRPLLKILGIAFCSYQVVNLEPGRSLLVIVGDIKSDRRGERLAANFASLCHRFAEGLGMTISHLRESKRDRHFRALLEVSRIVAETYELDQLMEKTLALIKEHLDTRLSYVLLYDELDGRKVKSISMEIEGKLLKLDPEMRNRLLTHARRKGMAPLADNLEQSPDELPEGENSLVNIPVVVDGRVVGVIRSSLRDYLEVDESDRDFLLALANQLAAGIKNVINYRDQMQKSEILEKINRLSVRVNEITGKDALFDFVERELQALCGAAAVRVVGPLPCIPGVSEPRPDPAGKWLAFLAANGERLLHAEGAFLHLRAEEDPCEGGERPPLPHHLAEGWEAVILPLGERNSGMFFAVMEFPPGESPDAAYLQQLLPTLAESLKSALERIVYFEEAVRERGKLQAVFDAMRDAVIVVDESGRIVSANREAERLFSLSRCGKIGERVRDSLDQRELEEYIEEDMGPGMEDERELLLQVDPPRTVKAYRARVILPGGRRHGRVVVLRDITHEKHLDNLKESFLACVSHELNTPLAIIVGYADILREGWSLFSDERKREFINSIKSSSEKLHRVITDILITTKISRGRLELDLKPCQLELVARDMVDQYRMIDKSHRYELVVRHGGCWCDVDEVKIRRVVWNLVDNARKFSPPGSTVELVVGKRKDGVFLAVKDEGMGISPWHLPSVFSKFSQIDSGDARRSSGLGVGLYLAKEIVSMHGGRIDVYSQPGRGSTFTIILPDCDFDLCLLGGGSAT